MSYATEWYAKNRDYARARAVIKQAKYRSLNIRLRALILSAQPCTDCGEPPDPDTPFEFDHREGIGAKSQRRISSLITKSSSHHQFMKEVVKCDVVCPTCHKARTYDRAQWKRATHRTTEAA
jgi:hypothetical protein